MAYRLAQLGLVTLLASTTFAVPHAGGQHMHLHERAVETVTVTAGQPAASPNAPAAAPAAKKAAAKPASGSSSSGGKAGLAYNDVSLLGDYGGKFDWCWNWGASSGGSTGSAKYVPMLKGEADKGAWPGVLSAYKSNGYAVMGYNEPDVSGIDANAAAAEYPSLFTTPLKGTDILKGTPGPTSSAGTGPQWLDTFLGACSSCDIDFAAIHWYANKDQSAETNAQAFISYITDTIDPIVAKHGNIPIWVTEFGYVPPANDGGRATNPADQATFIEQTLPFLNKHSSVAKYAFFMVGNDAGDMTGNVKSTYISNAA